ncbi:hypothetical protein GCM10020367_06630 [Streptomyces sannanensis]|uniref:RNA helicase n=1 Tax=Streptomyces sannanensis TaxID=285536 RepID=A0ABP6S542_9ACTN
MTDALTPYATAVNLRLATVVGGLSITRPLRYGAAPRCSWRVPADSTTSWSVTLFLDTKRPADRLAKRLLAVGVRAAALHRGRTQPQRNRTLEQIRSGQVTALVATNVAARGIHIHNLDLVVNVDPPPAT